MSTSQMARGPLQLIFGTASGQWLVLGVGVVAAFPEKVDQLFGTSFRQSLSALSSQSIKAAEVVTSPIVIHTGGSNHNDQNAVVTTLVTYGVGAGAIWVVYMVGTNMLPDWAKDMLPVSRSVFNKAINNLGKGILGVKDALSKQILGLSVKQDALAKKQNETHHEVVNIQNNLGDARRDISSLGDALGRCEGQLESAERLQIYTSRGVKLLVRCVANVLPSNDRIIAELLEFTKEGELYRSKSNALPMTNPNELTLAKQEINMLTSQNYQKNVLPTPEQIKYRGFVEEQSPENEHHPVTATPMTSRQSSNGPVDVNDMQELMQLVREGKIRMLQSA